MGDGARKDEDDVDDEVENEEGNAKLPDCCECWPVGPTDISEPSDMSVG